MTGSTGVRNSAVAPACRAITARPAGTETRGPLIEATRTFATTDASPIAALKRCHARAGAGRALAAQARSHGVDRPMRAVTAIEASGLFIAEPRSSKSRPTTITRRPPTEGSHGTDAAGPRAVPARCPCGAVGTSRAAARAGRRRQPQRCRPPARHQGTRASPGFHVSDRWSRHSDLNRGPAVYEVDRPKRCGMSVNGERGLPSQ